MQGVHTVMLCNSPKYSREAQHPFTIEVIGDNAAVGERGLAFIQVLGHAEISRMNQASVHKH